MKQMSSVFYGSDQQKVYWILNFYFHEKKNA